MALKTPLTPLPSLPAEIPADDVNNQVTANRAAIRALMENQTDIETRLVAVEQRATPGGPVVTVPITAAQEAALTAAPRGSTLVLQGPGQSFAAVRT